MRLIELVKPYVSRQHTDDELANLWKLIVGEYTTIKSGDEAEFTLESLITEVGVPLFNELVRRGKMTFDPSSWDGDFRELYLKIIDRAIKRGIWLPPEGEAILTDPFDEKGILLDKEVVPGAFWVYVSGDKAVGVIRVKDRKSDKMDGRFAYPVRDLILYDEPRKVTVSDTDKTPGKFIDPVKFQESLLQEGVSTPFGSPGGKRSLAGLITTLIPDHKTYVEPFCGAAAVLFKKKPSPVEVLNDKNTDIVDAFNFIKSVTEDKIKSLEHKNWLGSQTVWNSAVKKGGSLLEKYYKFMYRQRASFARKMDRFCSTLQGQNLMPNFKRTLIAKERIKEVVLRNQDYIKIIKEFDSPDTFFFVDPPYPFAAKVYGSFDIEPLVKTLKEVKGKWMLTVGYRPIYKKLFAGFHLRAVDVKQTMSAGSKDAVRKEYIITNYKLNSSRQWLRESDFDISDYDPERLKKLSNDELQAIHDKLGDVWVNRGKSDTDDTVINANLLVVGELNSRKVDIQNKTALDDISLRDLALASMKESAMNDWVTRVAAEIRESGDILCIRNFISRSGETALTSLQESHDLDWYIRSKKFDSSLSESLLSVLGKLSGGREPLKESDQGAGIRWTALYDFVLNPASGPGPGEGNLPGEFDLVLRLKEGLEDVLMDAFEGLSDNQGDLGCDQTDWAKNIRESSKVTDGDIEEFISNELVLSGLPVKEIKESDVPDLKELFKNNPAEYPDNYAVMQIHFRGKTAHLDFRRKNADYLMGETIMIQPEGMIDEGVDTVEQGKKWATELMSKGKFRPDMTPGGGAVVISKPRSPLTWLNVRDIVIEPGSAGASKYEPGVFILVDDGLAYPGVQTPFFREFFLDMKHFKGRMVERVIGDEKSDPKMKWLASTNLVDQTPYILSKRGRERKDYIPKEGEKAIPPEWESKIKTELQWWKPGLTSQERQERLDKAYNDIAGRDNEGGSSEE